MARGHATATGRNVDIDILNVINFLIAQMFSEQVSTDMVYGNLLPQLAVPKAQRHH